jgi:shikimate dehydrogenase
MLNSDQTVMDIVYSPLITPLLVEARAAGCLTIVGTEMLICQGAEAFRIWTGHEAPLQTMDAAVRGWIGGG